MDVYEVYVTEPADNELRDIAKYISSQLNPPTTALNMLLTIKTAIAQLETMALAYPLVRDDRLAALEYRLLSVKNYIIFYIVNEKERTVDVDRILYGLRDWRNLL